MNNILLDDILYSNNYNTSADICMSASGLCTWYSRFTHMHCLAPILSLTSTLCSHFVYLVSCLSSAITWTCFLFNY